MGSLEDGSRLEKGLTNISKIGSERDRGGSTDEPLAMPGTAHWGPLQLSGGRNDPRIVNDIYGTDSGGKRTNTGRILPANAIDVRTEIGWVREERGGRRM